MKNWIDLARVARETRLLEGRDLRGVDLSFQNLRRADCRDADFRDANFRDADCRDANFQSADFRDADFRDANFRRADCRRADFRRADCRGADFDFSCWPLWCGSKNVKVDGRIARQLLLHACSLDLSDDPDEDEYLDCVAACLDFIGKSHRFKEMTGR